MHKQEGVPDEKSEFGSELTSPKPEAGLIALTTAAVLPFSATWTLSGTGKDFAGLDLQLGQTLETEADPGLFAQDGFEGPLHANLAEGAALLDASTTLKAPAGKQALLVKPGSRRRGSLCTLGVPGRRLPAAKRAAD